MNSKICFPSVSKRLPDLNSYFKSFSWYVVFGVMTSVIPILFLPFLTKNLEASDFGLITSFNIVAMILGNLIRLDLNNSLKRFYAKEKNDFGRFVTGAFFCSLIAFVLISLMIGALSLLGVSELLNVPIEWLYLAGVLAFCRSQIMNLHHLWQIRNQSIRYGLWSVIAIILVYFLFAGLIVAGDANWTYRVVSELCVAIVGLTIAFFFLYRHYGFLAKTDFSTVKIMLRFSMPIMPGSFLSYYFITSDRIFISEIFTASQLGLYSLAFQVCSVLEIFFRAITPVWESWLYQDRGEGFTSSFTKLIIKIIASIFLLLIVIALISPFLIGIIANFLIDKKFEGVNQFLSSCTFAIMAAGSIDSPSESSG
jgi:O-antigen/teichoic acid export membrane protein